MKKGKWNYTEDIQYLAILVRILPIIDKPMYWQNAFAGQERQVLKVVAKDGYEFYIDNEDGSGQKKIDNGGGPDSYSAHLEKGTFEFIRELPESEWQQYDAKKRQFFDEACQKYQKEKDPGEYERMMSLRRMIQNKNFHVDKNGTIKPGKK